jgi:hypothetical protein
MKAEVIMKRAFLLVGLVVLFPALLCAEPWTKKQIMLEAACETLLLVDYGQTLNIAKNPNKYYERNPILGEHPSVESVSAYCLSWIVIHPLVTHFLPSKSKENKWVNRENWQYVTIAVEVGAIGNNFNIGIGLRF